MKALVVGQLKYFTQYSKICQTRLTCLAGTVTSSHTAAIHKLILLINLHAPPPPASHRPISTQISIVFFQFTIIGKYFHYNIRGIAWMSVFICGGVLKIKLSIVLQVRGFSPKISKSIDWFCVTLTLQFRDFSDVRELKSHINKIWLCNTMVMLLV